MRRAALEKDWTKGSIPGNLWSLSLPIVISSSLNVLGPVIDMVWVGKLGAASIAGVGIASMAVMLVTAARMSLAVGTRAMIARFMGAGDSSSANHVAQQAFVISGSYVIVMAAIGIFLAEPILNMMGVEADVVSEGTAYMRIMFVGSVAMSFRMMAEGIMQASGDTGCSFGSHVENAEAGERRGLDLVHTLVSSKDDWDRYEGLQWYATAKYASTHPDDPDLPELVERVAKDKAVYLRWGRDTLGWAIYVFRYRSAGGANAASAA